MSSSSENIILVSTESSSNENEQDEVIVLDESDIAGELEINADEADHEIDDDENIVGLENNNIDLASSAIEFVSGTRSDSKLLYVVAEEQLYQTCTKHMRNIGYWYRCRQKNINNCSVRVFYEYASQTTENQKNIHNHGSRKAEYVENKLKQNIKTEVKKLSALTSTTTNISEIFYRQCRE